MERSENVGWGDVVTSPPPDDAHAVRIIDLPALGEVKASSRPMPVHSAGILLYRRRKGVTEVFLVHPGGPFWTRRDAGAWSVPKGLVDPHEDLLAAARREFTEETGFTAEGKFEELGTFRLPSGKRLSVWAVEGDCVPEKLKSNLFEMAWPPKSKSMRSFPEIDRGGWFAREEALTKIVNGQRPMLEAFFTRAKA